MDACTALSDVKRVKFIVYFIIEHKEYCSVAVCMNYRVAQKMAPFLYPSTLPNVNRFFIIISLSESGENL